MKGRSVFRQRDEERPPSVLVVRGTFPGLAAVSLCSKRFRQREEEAHKRTDGDVLLQDVVPIAPRLLLHQAGPRSSPLPLVSSFPWFPRLFFSAFRDPAMTHFIVWEGFQRPGCH